MTEPYETYMGRIQSEEDKILFEEAIRCARAGALRAAYILTWLSAAESLKRRFGSLASQDHVAGKIIKDVETKESNHRAVDTFLLQKAQEYGLISGSEFSRLEHVYSMRCLFGHPYEQKPTQEALHAAMVDAVDIVLSRPTKLRHGFIESQIALLTENSAFLDDLQEAATRYACEICPRIADDLHIYLIEKLLEKLEAITSDASMALFFRRGIWFLRAYLSVDAASHLAAWDTVGALTRYPQSGALLLAQDQFWSHLSAHAREMAVGALLEAGKTSGEYLKALQDLHMTGAMSKREVTRFAQAVTSMDPAYLASAGISLAYFAATIIDKLKSHNWYTQNPAIQVLQNLGPREIADLPDEVQRELGNNVLQAADGSARDAIQFLDAIGTDSQRWPEAFISGIVEECFVNDRNEVRFKGRELSRALACLRSISRRAVSRILGRIAQRIRAGSVPAPWRVKERSEVLTVLGQADGLADAAALDSLKRAISELEVQEEDDFV